METQIAYHPGPTMMEYRIPAGLQPDANGHYRWSQREACRRCGGQGGSRSWPGFTCYECGGGGKGTYGKEAVTRERAEKLEANAIKLAAKHHRVYVTKAAAADATLLPVLGLTWSQTCELAAYDRYDGAAHDIARKVCHGATAKAKTGMEPSEAQWKVLTDLVERYEAKAKAAEPDEAPKLVLPEGRQTLQGKVVHAKYHHSDFGTTVKGLLLVERDGAEAKVWMSLPREGYEIVDDEPRPCRDLQLELAITLEASKDPGFYYGKRPAKVRALGEA